MLKGDKHMSKDMTKTQLKMAALGNHMMEAGAEIYKSPEVREKIKENLSKESQKD
jgi:hypothetical protein